MVRLWLRVAITVTFNPCSIGTWSPVRCPLVSTTTGFVGSSRRLDETVDAHAHAVRDAILDTAAALVAKKGLGSVTMSRIA